MWKRIAEQVMTRLTRKKKVRSTYLKFIEWGFVCFFVG